MQRSLIPYSIHNAHVGFQFFTIFRGLIPSNADCHLGGDSVLRWSSNVQILCALFRFEALRIEETIRFLMLDHRRCNSVVQLH